MLFNEIDSGCTLTTFVWRTPFEGLKEFRYSRQDQKWGALTEPLIIFSKIELRFGVVEAWEHNNFLFLCLFFTLSPYSVFLTFLFRSLARRWQICFNLLILLKYFLKIHLLMRRERSSRFRRTPSLPIM